MGSIPAYRERGARALSPSALGHLSNDDPVKPLAIISQGRIYTTTPTFEEHKPTIEDFELDDWDQIKRVGSQLEGMRK
jgi:hypothetical protein